MAPRNPQGDNQPRLRQPQSSPPLGGSLSIALTRFLERAATRRRLLADRMPQPAQEAEHQAAG